MKPYSKLRAELTAQGYDQTDVSLAIEKSRSYVNLRMNAQEVWEADDMQGIMKLIDKPWKKAPKYFTEEDIALAKANKAKRRCKQQKAA